MNSINKFLWQFVGSIFIFYYGLYPLFGFKVWIKYSGLNTISTEMSLINILIGLGIFIFVNIKHQKPNFSKCPKCKENYRYETLKDGMCPTCKIKTIKMDEYYQKYPQELDDI
jgi:hypothetical protein